MIAADAPLIAGGAADPNLRALERAFGRAGAPVRTAYVGDSVPGLVWDLDADVLALDGEPIRPRAVFVRHDVFASAGGGFRAMAWTAALVGWVLAHDDVRTPNRRMWAGNNNKPHALLAARRHGLRIPRTAVTNDRAAALAFADGGPKIAKPVAGGDLARPLDEALAMASSPRAVLAAPAIVQERLVPPEVRVYVVGDETFAFEVRSRHLDYRAANDAEVVALDGAPDDLGAPLIALARDLELDFGAADFKAGADGELRFLEINTSPMFARFELASGGRLGDAIAAWLR